MVEPIPRRFNVYKLLGGGKVADVLLWRRWVGSVIVLVGATGSWLLFERGGYNLLSFLANTSFLLLAILFLWGKSASLLNRPLPPIPNMEIPEETVAKVADVLQVYANYALSIARDIAIGRNLKLFAQVASGTWIASYIGNFCNFLTLLYIGVLLSLSVPFLYDRYQHHIDAKLSITHEILHTQYSKLEQILQDKIPLPSKKEKKTE
ncbi:hypothetical protein K2173_009208 [Erythroxylum novogranatense]|uniref:Reticulon-like protein n=1 Tax=Erythroxylum novogranatense TaxID=1862640 RepID=A0AAV8TL54_9ROSI|nr:hypothetical protein K2173_009208 [Erythroxylum novogranatense]